MEFDERPDDFQAEAESGTMVLRLHEEIEDMGKRGTSLHTSPDVGGSADCGTVVDEFHRRPNGSFGGAYKTSQAQTTKIRIDVDGTSVTAALDDTAAARDFVSLLPLTLTLEDYNGTEKISDLPQKLSTTGAPVGVEPSRGDIAYYAPWGNLAIFYKSFEYSRGLVKLGRLDSGVEIFEQSRALKVAIRRVDE